ncbi:hypothetical protein [Vibrio sp. SCSIO 43155]|uniref:hypothetical protein n=1 Tax=Vibrio sp. SCSIO 43155 TaxID=2819099 RepID=UPI0020762875|nr:hypothetical protein [Vibrio sp. SCSIO 43155]USD58547.1 hypothetical protein J4N44_28030 [Vibrio sp. SCSIO 43155]
MSTRERTVIRLNLENKLERECYAYISSTNKVTRGLIKEGFKHIAEIGPDFFLMRVCRSKKAKSLDCYLDRKAEGFDAIIEDIQSSDSKSSRVTELLLFGFYVTFYMKHQAVTTRQADEQNETLEVSIPEQKPIVSECKKVDKNLSKDASISQHFAKFNYMT